MSDNKTLKDSEVTSHEVWPSKLNKVIIGAGVIAFGLIIVDRVTNIFRAGDLPEPVAIERSVQTALVVESTAKPDGDAAAELVADSAVAVSDGADSVKQEIAEAGSEAAAAVVAVAETASDDAESVIAASEPATDAEAEDLVIASAESVTEAAPIDQTPAIEDVFGGSLVFVSAAEPLFVLTEDERRFDVGSSIDGETTLAGITDQRVILEKAGELMVLELPTPGE